MSDLNRRVAEIAFPDTVECGCDCGGHKWNLSANVQMPEHFDPCNRIDHAWMLVEWLVKEYEVTFGAWTLEPEVMWFFSVAEKGGDEIVFRKSKSMPEAITRAFLEACEEN